MWPTPTATPYGTTNNGTRDGSTAYATAGTPSLDTIAKLWPTATATAMDSFASRRHGYMLTGNQGTTLTDAMDQHIAGRRASKTRQGGRSTMVLNPEFVESLMGFPTGWTDLD